jgi:hypothetical protein
MSEQKEQQPAIKMGARSEETVTCAQCQKTLTVGERHAFKGKDGKDVYFCEECIHNINKALEEETKNSNLIGALGIGFFGAALGGALWYIITVSIQREIGYIGIGLGYLIGNAVMFGAGKKRGIKLQGISALLTFFAIIISELFIFAHFSVPVLREAGFEITELDLMTNLVLGSGEFKNIFMSEFMRAALSPIGLLIWGISVYTAFRVPQAHKLK